MRRTKFSSLTPRLEFETKQQRTSTHHHSLASSAWLEITQAWPNFHPISGPAKEGGSLNSSEDKRILKVEMLSNFRRKINLIVPIFATAKVTKNIYETSSIFFSEYDGQWQVQLKLVPAFNNVKPKDCYFILD